MTDSLILPPNSKAIFLTQGYYTIVDENDYEWLMQWKWRINRNRRNIYAIRNAKNEDKTPIKRACIAIHRQIMGYESPFQIDHINHNSLDNRRCNLRFCTSKQNWHNSRPRINKNSKYKGVTKNKNKGSENKWVANIMSANRKMYLGSYKTEEEAALAFDREAFKIYGEFAYLNFPEALEEKP